MGYGTKVLATLLGLGAAVACAEEKTACPSIQTFPVTVEVLAAEGADIDGAKAQVLEAGTDERRCIPAELPDGGFDVARLRCHDLGGGTYRIRATVDSMDYFEDIEVPATKCGATIGHVVVIDARPE